VTPDTVVRWHRQGWRLFWRWKSRSRGGRPHLSPEVRDLIITMSRDNRRWGMSTVTWMWFWIENSAAPLRKDRTASSS
jgi:hypothetical protein